MRAGQAILVAAVLIVGGAVFYQLHQQSTTLGGLLEAEEARTTGPLEGGDETPDPTPTLLALTEAVASSKAATEALTATLQDAPAALEVDGPITPIDAALVLSQLSSERIRHEAATILGELGGEKATARLVALAETDPESDVRHQALEVLGQIGHPDFDRMVLAEAAEGEMAHRIGALRLLERGTPAKYVPELLDMLQGLRGGHGHVVEMRGLIYGLLARVHDPKIVPQLLALAEEETDSYRKRTLFAAIRSNMTRDNVPAVCAMLAGLSNDDLNNGYGELRHMFQRFAAMGDWRVTPTLIQMLKTTTHSTLRRYMLETLDKLQDPLAAEFLVEYEPKSDSSAKSMIQKMLDGYPGVVKEGKGFARVDDEAWAELMKQRKARIAADLKALEEIGPDRPAVF